MAWRSSWREAASGEVTISASLTHEGKVAGTLSYMSPEQIEGKPADARSDIFSFGTVLLEMLTGSRAFARPSVANVVAAILKEDPLPNGSLPPMPAALDRTFRKCLEKEPDRRWQSAADLRDELAWIAESGPKAPAKGPELRSGERRWKWLMFVGVPTLALIALA